MTGTSLALRFSSGFAAAVWCLPIIMLMAPINSQASHLDGFVFDFETDADLEFLFSSPTLHPQAGVVADLGYTGGEFLGSFQEETLSFYGMDALACYGYCTTVYLAFDLILTGQDWLGDDATSLFSLNANGQQLLNATFSNTLGSSQSYPADYLGGSSPAGTDSVLFVNGILSVYSFYFAFPSNGIGGDVLVDMTVQFDGPVGSSWYDMSWGIDNFVVSSTPIPEPGVGVLFATGLVALAAIRRRRVRDA